VRALVRFRWLVPALALPACIALAGVGIQAAAFRRPARETLVAAEALHELLQYRVMRGTEQIGRQRLATTCVQGWYHTPRHRHLVPGAIVLVSNGERLYDFGNGVRRLGRQGRAGLTDRARFLLAACPRSIAERISVHLLGGQGVDTDPSHDDGASALAIAFGGRRRPIDLYVNRGTYRPVELKLSGTVRGWSDLEPGGGRRAVIRVRRAFHLRTRPKVQRA